MVENLLSGRFEPAFETATEGKTNFLGGGPYPAI
jgi:hypothetical protein